MTVEGQSSFLAAIFSMAANIVPQKPFSVQKASADDKIRLVSQTFAAPTVASEVVGSDRRRLTIVGVPPISASELNHCAIERIINHIKDSYLKGKFDDAELEAYCNKLSSESHKVQDFCFCLTYLFSHDNERTLTVDFYISHTEATPAWGKYTRKGKFVPVTLMSQDEVDLVANAFMRQCVRALRSYTTLIYNDAASAKKAPNYYDVLPK